MGVTMQFLLCRNTLAILLLSLLLFLPLSRCLADNPQDTAETDSTSQWESPRSAETTGDRILAAPGRVIYFPFKICLQGMKETFEYVDENEIVDKIRNFLTAYDDSWGFYPTYNATHGVGIYYFHRDVFTPDDKFRVESSLGLNYRQFYEISMRRVKFFERRLTTRWSARYHLMPDEHFFGIGNNTSHKNEVEYMVETWAVDGGLEFQITEPLSIEAFYGFEHNWTDEEKDADDDAPYDPSDPSFNDLFPETAGFHEIIEMTRLELVLNYDSRNTRGNPSRGINARVGGGFYSQVDDDIYGFTKGGFDLRTYHHLFLGRTLVLRAAGEFADSFDDRLIPYYYLPELGHYSTIRGFDRGRFRNNDMVLGSVEYRYPVNRIWKRGGADAVLFFDAGQVSSDIFTHFKAKEFNTAFGMGLRVYTSEELLVQANCGISREGWRVNLQLNQ